MRCRCFGVEPRNELPRRLNHPRIDCLRRPSYKGRCSAHPQTQGPKSALKDRFQRVSLGGEEIALDAAGEIPYSRLLTSQTKCFADNRWSLSTDRNCHNPRGWVRIWGLRDDEVPADHEAFDRPQGSERHASDKPSAPAVAIPGSCGDRAATERPIAPGKVSCPSPPWDTAFPGAFFAHRWRLSLEVFESRRT